jgi:hypothetical protein
MYSMMVEDVADGMTARIDARRHLDDQLSKPFIVEKPTDQPGAMTKREFDLERERQMRADWGKDAEAQSRWKKT